MITCCDKHLAWSVLGTPPLAKNENRCDGKSMERREDGSEVLHGSAQRQTAGGSGSISAGTVDGGILLPPVPEHDGRVVHKSGR